MLRQTRRKGAAGADIMMAYYFDRSPIYAPGNVAATWAIAALLFALMFFA